MPEYIVNLPYPHPMQAQILASKAKRHCVCSGRRSGKTTLAASLAVEKLFEGRRVLLSSTTQDQADAFWEKCTAWLRPLIDAGIVQRNIQRRILTYGDKGRIKVKTASDADSLRGDYADFLVLDECALLDPDAWEKVGAPMLLDNDGDAWFISTPRSRNWFYHLFQKAAADETGRWQAWHFTSYDNPHLSKDALAELTGDMTSEDIDQEILAKFLEGQGAVFRNIDACLNAPVGATPEQHAGHDIVGAIDWAQVKDWTVIGVGCADCRVELEIDRFNQISWAIQRERVRTMHDRWKPYTWLAERNSIGSPNIEALVDEDIPVSAFDTTATSKPPLIKSLVRAFERAEFQWLPNPIARAELEAYEQKVSPNTNHVQYGAPSGLNDDTVMYRALLLRASGTWGSLA